MIKTLNINLGGMAFIIDENAFELLHNYLETLKRKFNNAAEREEIMNDIELRIAELLTQSLANRKEVVSFSDVQAVIDALGKPEDIAGEEAETQEPAGNRAAAPGATASATTGPVHKRLYRDPDDAKIGGVISGLCHYFGIADPVWMRVAALVLIPFTSFSIVFLYLLLLVIIPKANTAAEKLQMKGEPININTIEKEIKDAASRAGESVHDIVHNGNFFERVWGIGMSLGRVFIILFSLGLIAFAMFFLVIVGIGFVSFYILGTSQFYPVAKILVDSSSTLTVFSIGFFLFFATPFIGLVYAGLKMLLGRRSRVRWLSIALFIAWFIGLVMLIASTGKVVTNFKSSSTKKYTSMLMQPARGALYVQLVDSNGNKIDKSDYEDANYNFNIDWDGMFINGVNFNDINMLPINKPSLQLMPSDNDSFYIQELITSRGRNTGDAEKNTAAVVYNYSQVDTVLDLRPLAYIAKNAKWRAQNVKIRLAIPEGKKVSFADNIDLWQATVKGFGDYDDTYFANTTWTVENGKVKCIAGENHRNGDGESQQETTTKKEKSHSKVKKQDDDNSSKEDEDGSSDKDF
ncbi:MAG TPA: PspC domain-containing protein [Chitinophagales bacterium]|nr:PspC domain-containing protein [Chitinophagales bacterium]